MVQVLSRPKDELGIKVNASIVKLFCKICERKFKREQIVVRVLGGEFVHKRGCWHKYIARAAKVYELSYKDVMEHFHVSRRTAFRILEHAEEMSDW